MRKMILAVTAAGLVALALLSGCTDKEMQAAYQQSLTTSAAQVDTIRMLRNTIQTKSDSLTMVLDMRGSAEMRLDTLMQKYQRATNNVAGLNKQLKNLQEECAAREEALLTGIRERDSVLTVIDALFSDTNVTLTQIRGELGNEKTRSAWLSDLLNKVKPWYKKWKHDATKRNFLQVLFASGKAKAPEFPEPNLDSLRMPVDTVQQIVPTDTAAIRQIRL